MSTPAVDFTLTVYREALLRAKELGYAVMRLCDTDQGELPKLALVLRHDIDFSVRAALRMAQLEAKLGICSSYCVLLHSPTYQVTESTTLQHIREIVALGHEVALHYDSQFFSENGIAMDFGIAMEADYLGWLIGVPIRSIAQHRPAKHGSHPLVNGRYVDAYHPRLTRDIRYISDSRRVWRSGSLTENVEKRISLQVLVHPEWWTTEDQTRQNIIDSLCRNAQDQVGAAMREYADGLER